MGNSAPAGVDTGDTPPVGSVSMFRSAAGQPAARKHLLRFQPVTVRSCNQTVEVGTCGVGVHHGITVPDVAIFCSTLATLVPSLPQFAAALSARAGLVQVIVNLLAVCSGPPWPEVFRDSLAGERPIPIRPGEAKSALQACTRRGIARPRAYRCSGGTKNLRSFSSPPPIGRPSHASKTRRDPAARRGLFTADFFSLAAVTPGSPFQKRTGSNGFLCRSM